MKNKVLIFILFVISGLFTYAQENLLNKPFYYYKGEKFYLETDYSRINVISEGKFDAKIESKIAFSIKNEGKSYTKQIIVLFDNAEKTQHKEIFITEIEFSKFLSQSDCKEIIRQFDNIDNVVKTMPAYTVTGQKIGISNNFYVKLFKEEDKDKLFELAKKYSVQVLGYNEFMPLWFTLSCDKKSSLNNALEIANLFYETGLFECSEPELLCNNSIESNDQYFPDQWGLKNTGQYGGTAGVDINAEKAWEITTGSPNIRVAVFDQGIQEEHPDLAFNFYGPGYDAETNTNPAVLCNFHGTPCAGIIAAHQNNAIGISGIAPTSQLISISITLLWLNTPQQFANGFNWAWRAGADVISNSWGGYAPSNILDNAIANAQSQGRNGLGCVIVFAAGNDNDSVLYPAKLPNVIAVGAVDRCGIRAGRIDIVPNSCDPWCPTCKPGSAHGSALDVVAPGTNISTTDVTGGIGYNHDPITTNDPAYSDYINRDYTGKFGGTSAACPHVAGIAALILSVNPDLTHRTVRNIIEQTAQKVGGYNYNNSMLYTNGSWNNEMGYGLVDACAAVKMAKGLNCNSISLSGYQPEIPETYKQVICNYISTDATVPTGTKLELNAVGSGAITLNAGFTVEAGAELEINCIP